MSDNNTNNDINRLSSLLPSGIQGGLITKKKSNNNSGDTSDNNKSKGKSLLGLDRPYKDTKNNSTIPHNSNNRDFGRDKQRDKHRDKSRNYRRHESETPSHPGGIDRLAQIRARERE